MKTTKQLKKCLGLDKKLWVKKNINEALLECNANYLHISESIALIDQEWLRVFFPTVDFINFLLLNTAY